MSDCGQVEALEQLLSEAGVFGRLWLEAESEWHAVSSKVDYLPTEYSRTEIDYQIAYFKEANLALQDISLVLKPIANLMQPKKKLYLLIKILEM